jgi:hypothetical protein
MKKQIRITKKALKTSNDTLSDLCTSLKKEVALLKEIIKENFIYSPTSSRPIDFKNKFPEMKQEIMEILLREK